mgnify:FL=1
MANHQDLRLGALLILRWLVRTYVSPSPLGPNTMANHQDLRLGAL